MTIPTLNFVVRVIVECKDCGTDTCVVVPVNLPPGRNFCQEPVECPKCHKAVLIVVNR